ncbi:hypothetical protein VTK73DRAFT_830 [Phialemonium thermophilum]|uniref:RTA1 like protein n=1 Tax=Phialemonium thermophilum TaxID=223376 RepID=A0ABR3VUC5_9PEZI
MNNASAPGNSTDTGAAPAFDFRLYRYAPSLPAAIVAAGVFSVLTAVHTWRLLRSRAIYFTAFTVGGVFQVVGYCGRIWSHFDSTAIGGFVVQAILILVAPALYAASIYMILGRLMRSLHAESLSLIPVRWLTKTFVAADVLSFTLQAGGGGIQAGGTLELYQVGEKVIVVGLFLQIAFFGFFIFTTVVFHRRLSARQRGHVSQQAHAIPWRRHLVVLYVVSIVIFVRSVFRVVEYLQGNDGYIVSHEWFLYVFDAFLMATVMAVLAVYYVDDLVEAMSRRAKARSSTSEHHLMDDMTV